ncbi:MAG: metallophosphoesterase, partial [Planctomycetota bacterium]
RGLTGGADYELTVESGGDSAGPYVFAAAPAGREPFQLLFGGDSRSGIEHRRKMNQLLERITSEARRQGRPPVVALAHGGDFVNNGRRLPEWRQWLDDYQLTTSPAGRLLPIIPTRGNHDYGDLFNEVFDFPPGDRNYYATDLTPSVRLLTLNTETSTAGDQLAWLRGQLEAPSPTASTWLLCQYHKPAFPAVKVPSGAYANWVPLFEQHGVDVCLEADGHCIKRTPPILGNRFDPAGVVYLGEGGLGVGQRSPKTNRWYLQRPAVTGRGHHVQVLAFDGEQLTGRVLMEDGSTFDEFRLAPRPKRGVADK